MICKGPPNHLFKRTSVSRETKIIVFKILQRECLKRPSTRFLLLCPSLVSHVAKVYLNLGRAYATPPNQFGIKIFQPFLKQSSSQS